MPTDKEIQRLSKQLNVMRKLYRDNGIERHDGSPLASMFDEGYDKLEATYLKARDTSNN